MNDGYKSQQANSYAVGQSDYINQINIDQAAVSKVLRNTYSLLSLTLAFSAITCYIGMLMNVVRMPAIIFFIGAYGLMFLTSSLRNSAWGLLSTFVFTGFMGFSLAPTINAFMYLPNGGQIVLTALALTAFAFFGLSAFVLITRKDMSFLSNFITVGFFVLIGAMVAFFLTGISALALAISVGFILFSSAAILYQTSEIIHGTETNYIMATISLYVSIYNLFVSLLNILGLASSD